MSDWRSQLDDFFVKADDADKKKEVGPFTQFLRDVAVPAFEELKLEFERHGRTVVIRDSESSASISVSFEGAEEMTYRIHERLFVDRALPYAEIRVRERKGLRLITVESMVRSGGQDYELRDITRDEVLKSVLQQYIQRVKPR